MTKKQLEWADTVIVMENEQRTEISKRFPEEYIKKQILSLNIPDIYQHNQSELIQELKSKMNKLISAIPQTAS